MKKSRIYWLLLVVIVAAMLWRIGPSSPSVTQTEETSAGDASFDRHLEPLIYTKHARCRMGCRSIDESEVKDILYNGRINYTKSDLQGKPDPKYALEGITRDKQHVRIIFAPSRKGMVVITCIDIQEEWACDCR